MFERFGVAEYWVVDPGARRVEVRILERGRYRPPVTADRGGEFRSRILTRFSCDIEALFG